MSVYVPDGKGGLKEIKRTPSASGPLVVKSINKGFHRSTSVLIPMSVTRGTETVTDVEFSLSTSRKKQDWRKAEVENGIPHLRVRNFEPGTYFVSARHGDTVVDAGRVIIN